jgi:hypothetical protein
LGFVAPATLGNWFAHDIDVLHRRRCQAATLVLIGLRKAAESRPSGRDGRELPVCATVSSACRCRMPRIVPSQIVDLVKSSFPDEVLGTKTPSAERSTAGQLSAILRLIDELPPEFFIVGGKPYSDFIANVESVREHAALSRSDGGAQYWFGAILRSERNPLQTIVDYLERCPDDVPSRDTTALSFVTDAELRNSIRGDLSMAASGLHNGEWKAATVLAGAACEALLLWGLNGRAADARKVVRSLCPSEKRSMEHWSLDTMIAIAEKLNLIAQETAKQTELAKGFRNLIHPGRAQRLGQVCDKATAHAGMAAAEAISRDLSK